MGVGWGGIFGFFGWLVLGDCIWFNATVQNYAIDFAVAGDQFAQQATDLYYMAVLIFIGSH